ncbi:hypothetical protein ACQ4PT_001882 [Festuca glaucescens]
MGPSAAADAATTPGVKDAMSLSAAEDAMAAKRPAEDVVMTEKGSAASKGSPSTEVCPGDAPASLGEVTVDPPEANEADAEVALATQGASALKSPILTLPPWRWPRKAATWARTANATVDAMERALERCRELWLSKPPPVMHKIDAVPSVLAQNFRSISLPSNTISRLVRSCAARVEKSMAIGSMLSRKRKPLDAATEVFNVCPERAREAVRQRFQSELVAVRRLLEKAAALPVPVPRSEEPPAKRSKEASIAPVVARKMMAEEEEDVDVLPGVSPMAIAPPRLQPAKDDDEHADICGDASPEKMPKYFGDDAAIKSEESVDTTEEDVEEDEEDVDICGGVSPLVIAPAPLQLAEDDDMDICGDASPVVLPKNLGDATISSSPSSSSSSGDTDSVSDSASDGSSSSDSDSDSDESVDGPAPADRVATPPRAVLIARAKESQERQLKEARSRAREKARQEVLKTERTAMPDSERVHWTVFKSIDIKEYNMAMPENVLHQRGLFLKPDDDGDQEEQLHRHSFEEDLEEGEIRF